MNSQQTTGGRDGMVLFAVLAVIGGLALICGTVFILTSTNVKIAASQRESMLAFYNTDAAVNYIKTRIDSSLAGGTIALSGGASEQVVYTAPAGYSFHPVTNLLCLADGLSYMFAVRGYQSNSTDEIQVTFKRKRAMNLGVFGDDEIDMKANGNVYSYYSATVPNPSPAQSTGEADVGSNMDAITHNGTYIHGSLLLGEDPFGNAGQWSDPGGGAIITGDAGANVPRVEPDPLGAAAGGSLAQEFIQVMAANNNAQAVPPIPANRNVSLGNGQSMTLRSGRYHVNSIELKNGSTLNIVATNGPVKVYLTGSADFKNGSAVNVTGIPPDHHLYCNSSGDIRMFHGSAFRGLIYAPFANVEVKNSGDFQGLAWGDTIDIKNSGNVYVDLTLMNSLLSKSIQLLTWKEVRPL